MFHKSMRGLMVDSLLSIVMSTVQLPAPLFLTFSVVDGIRTSDIEM